MKTCEIHLRDPFVLYEDGKYYMYGSRAKDFGVKTGGFDVYVSQDLENWSEPIECFNSIENRMNLEANWAPEVHKYRGAYYMFATFTRERNRLRATYVLKSDSPLGPFKPHSKGGVTPVDWMCIDGTFYVDDNGVPYIVYCHEHSYIVDGTMCYTRLSDDLTEPVGEPTFLFSASSPYWADKLPRGEHYITDGPFMYKTKAGELLMIWSTFINEKYAECAVRFKDGKLGTEFEHLPPVMNDDGGHGMIFKDENKTYLSLHYPNTLGLERPRFYEIEDLGDTISVK